MSTVVSPWYKQFWLWFILTPLFIVMAAGFFMLYLAIVTSDGVIIDNPYKDGKGFIERTEEDEFARLHQLSGELNWTDSVITIQLSGDLSPMPESLDLLIAHPTAKNFDTSLVLQHQGLGKFIGKVATPVTGRRQLLLQPVGTEQGWRLHFDGEVPPPTMRLELLPKQE